MRFPKDLSRFCCCGGLVVAALLPVHAFDGRPSGAFESTGSPAIVQHRGAKKPTRKIIIQGGVLNGKAIDLPKPEFPAGRRPDVSGAVIVKILVNERGKAISARAISGHSLLRASAVSAARKAKFEPVTLSGVPMKVSGFLVYNYETDLVSAPTVSTIKDDTTPNDQSGNGRVNALPRGRTVSNVVSGGILNGKATLLPSPVYPPVARAAQASGTVNVQVTVDEEGNVISAVAVSGHPLLRAAAVNAARGAKFNPTKLSGVPVKVVGVLVYNFLPADPPKDSSPPPVASAAPSDKLVQPPGSINGGILNGKAISLPKPPYPPVARAAHASGGVEVQVIVDETGVVAEAKAISGNPLLRAAATSAARGARFEPTLLEGRPVKIFGVILYEFIAD
jgi:TonB family protein